MSLINIFENPLASPTCCPNNTHKTHKAISHSLLDCGGDKAALLSQTETFCVLWSVGQVSGVKLIKMNLLIVK